MADRMEDETNVSETPPLGPSTNVGTPTLPAPTNGTNSGEERPNGERPKAIDALLPMSSIAELDKSGALVVDRQRLIGPRKRLLDEHVASLVKADGKMIHALRTIARGEALVDRQALRERYEDWTRDLRALDLAPEALEGVLEILQDAYRQGAKQAINPMAVIKAFEAVMKVGHPKIANPPDPGAVKHVTINVNVGSREEAAKEVREVIEVESRPEAGSA